MSVLVAIAIPDDEAAHMAAIAYERRLTWEEYVLEALRTDMDANLRMMEQYQYLRSEGSDGNDTR